MALAISMAASVVIAAYAAEAGGHFDPKGKPPSSFTREVLRQAGTTLPFTDTRDFAEQKKGFIAPAEDTKIMADDGHVAWDGQEAEVMFASHHWPRWGNARIQEVLRGQRDLYAHMNNQVLHLANQGVTISEIHNAKTLDAQIADGTAKVVGDAGVLKQLASTMVDFDPRFPIMPGTKLRTTAPGKTDPFSTTVGDVTAE